MSGIPFLIGLAVEQAKQEQIKREKEEALRAKIEEAAKNGQLGEAARRLFNVKD